ncbi:MAG: EAL domain-containing protein [Acidimicrobiales bacterium]|jgi:diguanylate cyclase (GGDEF)-like protein/PAS domain S-box-containing protein
MEPAWLERLALELPDAVVVADAEGRLVWGNPAAERIFGLAVTDIVGLSALEFLHPEDLELAATSLVSVRDKNVGSPIELRVKTPTGWKLVELIGANLVGKQPINGLVWCLRDLTERRRWEVATNDIEQFRSLVHNSASILLLLDGRGTVRSVSAAITRMLGHDQALVEGHPLEDLAVAADRPALRAALDSALDSGPVEEGPIIVEVNLRRRDGGVPVPCELSIVNLLDDPTVNGLAVSAHNITQLRSTRDALERLATRDPLTGLPNRKLILDRIEQMQKRGRRTGHDGAVLFIDLDRFKDVNDSLGHRVGDDVLRQAAVRFQSALRESDSIGRLGGDEFVVLVEGSGAHHAEAAARRLLESLAVPFAVHSTARPRLTISASIGIVSGAYSSAEDLLMDADVALYEAKAAGRNRAMRFEPHMRGEFRTRIDLERDLRLALEAGEFFLVYQPVVELTDGTVKSMEALLRWRRPSGLVVGPDDFIPALEESGLIVEVGAFVLREACLQTRRWYDAGLPTAVSVNVSPRQFETAALVDEIKMALESSGLDPTWLILEMTETTLMRDSGESALRLTALKDLGIRLAIDDFGTGYSSMAYLQQFPVDILKIDRTFIPETSTDKASIALVHALVELGNALGLKTVAEGIETIEQLMQLRHEGCDAGQGFYFSRPLEAADAQRFLEQAVEGVLVATPGPAAL